MLGVQHRESDTSWRYLKGSYELSQSDIAAPSLIDESSDRENKGLFILSKSEVQSVLTTG